MTVKFSTKPWRPEDNEMSFKEQTWILNKHQLRIPALEKYISKPNITQKYFQIYKNWENVIPAQLYYDNSIWRLEHTISHVDLFDVLGGLHTKMAKRKLTKIDHMLGHKISPKIFKKIKVIQTLFTDPNRILSEVSNHKIYRTTFQLPGN